MFRLCIAAVACTLMAAPCLAQTETLSGPVEPSGSTGLSSVSSAGMGRLGSEVQASNRDCLPRGSTRREVSVPSAPGAISCAPVGSGPATGYAPAIPPKAGPTGQAPTTATSGSTPAMRQ
jgi:hypothetical protein